MLENVEDNNLNLLKFDIGEITSLRKLFCSPHWSGKENINK